MKVVVSLAPFKGTMTADEACEIVAQAIADLDDNLEIENIPVVDGGEGTGRVLGKLFQAQPISIQVMSPLYEPTQATYWLTKDGKAFLDMASASGLHLVPPHLRNPLNTTTYGTGVMIRDAMNREAKEIWVGVGGSATVDGGLGCALALGVKAFANGRLLEKGTGAELLFLTSAEFPHVDWKGKMFILTDVRNFLCGVEGAAAVYGPQKGATPETIPLFDQALSRWAVLLEEASGKSLQNIPGMGAAGGIALPLVAFWNATILNGATHILDFLQYDARIADATIVVTGEGMIDGQTMYGKAPSEVVRKCAQKKIPCVVLCGQLGPGFDALLNFEVAAILPCFHSFYEPNNPEEAKRRLSEIARRFFRLFLLLSKKVNRYANQN